MIILKSDREIEYMREAGRIVARTLEILKAAVRPGITTGELDRIAEEYLRKEGAIPAFKGYNGFPATICASVNEEVVHGIPGKRVLKEGEIISIDMGAVLNGYYGDAAITVPVGEIEKSWQDLLTATEESLYEGIKKAQKGNKLGMVSNAIQTYVESRGFSVVRQYVGHGVGTSLHEDPPVPNYGRPDRGPVLKTGMTLAIEPMVNLGGYEVYTKMDDWTVVTRDGLPSAHFEHTVAITDRGPEILTRP